MLSISWEFEFGSQSEICQFELHLMIDQQVSQFNAKIGSNLLSMDDLLVVEIAEPINELVDEILALWDGQLFPFLYQVKHILHGTICTPLLHSSRSM